MTIFETSAVSTYLSDAFDRNLDFLAKSIQIPTKIQNSFSDFECGLLKQEVMQNTIFSFKVTHQSHEH